MKKTNRTALVAVTIAAGLTAGASTASSAAAHGGSPLAAHVL